MARWIRFQHAGFIFNGPAQAEWKAWFFFLFASVSKREKMLRETQLRDFSCRWNLQITEAGRPKPNIKTAGASSDLVGMCFGSARLSTGPPDRATELSGQQPWARLRALGGGGSEPGCRFCCAC